MSPVFLALLAVCTNAQTQVGSTMNAPPKTWFGPSPSLPVGAQSFFGSLPSMLASSQQPNEGPYGRMPAIGLRNLGFPQLPFAQIGASQSGVDRILAASQMFRGEEEHSHEEEEDDHSHEHGVSAMGQKSSGFPVYGGESESHEEEDESHEKEGMNVGMPQQGAFQSPQQILGMLNPSISAMGQKNIGIPMYEEEGESREKEGMTVGWPQQRAFRSPQQMFNSKQQVQQQTTMPRQTRQMQQYQQLYQPIYQSQDGQSQTLSPFQRLFTRYGAADSMKNYPPGPFSAPLGAVFSPLLQGDFGMGIMDGVRAGPFQMLQQTQFPPQLQQFRAFQNPILGNFRGGESDFSGAVGALPDGFESPPLL